MNTEARAPRKQIGVRVMQRANKELKFPLFEDYQKPKHFDHWAAVLKQHLELHDSSYRPWWGEAWDEFEEDRYFTEKDVKRAVDVMHSVERDEDNREVRDGLRESAERKGTFKRKLFVEGTYRFAEDTA
jgi:hypothetical protein